MADYKFGTTSNGKLATCCQELRLVANRAIVLTNYDFSIIWGWRGEDIQNALLASGASTKGWPESKHNAHDVEGRWVGGIDGVLNAAVGIGHGAVGSDAAAGRDP